MTLQKNLELAIELHWMKGPKPPQCIIAHPRTVFNLTTELCSKIGTAFLAPPLTNNIKYKGISVYRSEDVKENNFEIY